MSVCSKCNGTGKYHNALNIEVTCDCNYQKVAEPKPIQPVLTQADTIVCGGSAKCLIPEYRINDAFILADLRSRAQLLPTTKDLSGSKLAEYEQLMCSIFCTIEQRGKLPCSYLIGSPKGLSKTTLANTCIKLLNKQEKRVVPYTSLLDIYEVYLQNLKNQLIETRQLQIQECHDNRSDIVQAYTLKDFLDCDILFTQLISPEFKYQEISMLRLLLEHRGKLGKPTIVFSNIPLVAYLAYRDDKRYFWDDYTTYPKQSPGVGSLNVHMYFKTK